MILTKSAQKDFKNLPKSEKKKVIKKLRAIELSSLSGKLLKGELGDLFSIRAWPYRILYEFNKKSVLVIIHKIQHRQGAYK